MCVCVCFFKIDVGGLHCSLRLDRILEICLCRTLDTLAAKVCLCRMLETLAAKVCLCRTLDTLTVKICFCRTLDTLTNNMFV